MRLVLRLGGGGLAESTSPELRYAYLHPCPKNFHGFPTVLVCPTKLFYKVYWAWACIYSTYLSIYIYIYIYIHIHNGYECHSPSPARHSSLYAQSPY